MEGKEKGMKERRKQERVGTEGEERGKETQRE